MHNAPWEELTACANKARLHAYAPYSKLLVGAAVWAGGRIFSGCNVENASFGLTLCAERNALAHTIAQAERPKALLLLADTPHPIVPCGACRQVLVELCTPELPLLCCTLSGLQRPLLLSQLLPFAFDKSFLGPAPRAIF
ncbi:MAG: cytidine deaminase [Proteobacteria bacterium]|nr:cytidine deaminase [Cystobacterineae bacterium]MCL2259281.1 cytidine deaminase [Cystobacterineae bacterium]MCL2314319.1 cytidine deaminase [Pseudomonadota bacterium]